MNFKMFAEGSFTNEDDKYIGVELYTTAIDVKQVTPLRFIKEQAVVISCEGELIKDKLHNTRIAVRVYMDDRNELLWFINKYLKSDADTVLVQVYYNKQDSTHHGYLDMEGIEFYESRSYGYVLELVFGDFNPLKRVRANVSGIVSTLGYVTEILRPLTSTSAAFDGDAEIYESLMPSYLLDGGVSGFQFDSSVLGEDPSVYDVLEVCAEAMCGSIRQVDGFFEILNIVEWFNIPYEFKHKVERTVIDGVTYSNGRAYNEFVYKLKGAESVTKNLKLLGVDGAVFKPGGTCPIMPDEFYKFDPKEFSSVHRRATYPYGKLHGSDYFALVKGGKIDALPAPEDGERVIIGKAIYDGFHINGVPVFSTKQDAEVLELGNVVKLYESAIDAINSVLADKAILAKKYFECLALFYTAVGSNPDDDPSDRIIYLNLADRNRGLVEKTSATDLYEGDTSEVRNRLTAMKSQCETSAWQLKAKRDGIVAKRAPADAVAIQKSVKDEYVAGLILTNGRPMISPDGDVRALRFLFRPKSELMPITIDLVGGTVYLGDNLKDFIKERVIHSADDKYEPPHLLLPFDARCKANGVDYVLDYRRVRTSSEFKWKKTSEVGEGGAVHYFDFGEAFSEDMGGTIKLPPLPKGAELLEVSIESKWKLGYKFWNEFVGGDGEIAPDVALALYRLQSEFAKISRGDYTLITYLSRVNIEQGYSNAYMDRQAVLKTNKGGQFCETLEYETRVGTALGTGANIYTDKGTLMTTFLPDNVTAKGGDKYENIGAVKSHESYLLYSLAITYGRRRTIAEFETLHTDSSDIASFMSFQGPVYAGITTKYELDASSGRAKVTLSELAGNIDPELRLLAGQASERMKAAAYDKATDGGTSKTTSGRRR